MDMIPNYRKINYEVMCDTAFCCKSNAVLKEAIRESIENQFMVAHEQNIDQPICELSETKYIVSGKRSFEAAKGYRGKKVAVLNYANNHSVGGAPYSAGAQEESLCRCSTLLPCIEAMKQPFYNRHIDMYSQGKIDCMGNDDLIYTPGILVFKTDERTKVIYPKTMDENDWYRVNVITCAAPELFRCFTQPSDYVDIIHSRIKKILDVAAKEKNEVLILGAWGCGAFHNDINVVAREFVNQLKNYNFETVEFALASTHDVSDSAFSRELRSSNSELPN